MLLPNDILPDALLSSQMIKLDSLTAIRWPIKGNVSRELGGELDSANDKSSFEDVTVML
jgi:hypothetical protein